MLTADTARIEAIKRDPDFAKLVKKRTILTRRLTISMLLICFGFILAAAFVPKSLGVPLGTGVTTVGMLLGFLAVASAFVLTGIYVRRANVEFDALTRKIIERVS